MFLYEIIMIICIYITREKEKSHMISQQSKLKLWLSVLIFLTVFSGFFLIRVEARRLFNMGKGASMV